MSLQKGWGRGEEDKRDDGEISVEENRVEETDMCSFLSMCESIKYWHKGRWSIREEMGAESAFYSTQLLTKLRDLKH